MEFYWSLLEFYWSSTGFRCCVLTHRLHPPSSQQLRSLEEFGTERVSWMFYAWRLGTPSPDHNGTSRADGRAWWRHSRVVVTSFPCIRPFSGQARKEVPTRRTPSHKCFCRGQFANILVHCGVEFLNYSFGDDL